MSSQPADRTPSETPNTPLPAPKPESARTTPEPRDDNLLESVGKAVAAPVIDAEKTVPDQNATPPAPAASPPRGGR